MDNSANRREYFRIDDRISLRMDPLAQGESNLHEDTFEARRRETGLANHFAANQEKHRGEKKRIEQKHPEIASYLAYLEEEIQVLATRLSKSENGLPTVPTHDVNICAEGLRVELDSPVVADEKLEISMMLFPSNASVFCIGEVIRCDEITEGDELQIGRFTAAIRFTQIDDEDKEAIVKHIHQKQLIQLQERQAAVNA